MNGQSQALVYIALIATQILFGINYATSKVIVTKLDPFIWSNLRFVIAGLIMLSYCLITRRKHPIINKNFILPILPLSLLGMALGQGLFLLGLKNTTSVNTAIITTSIPILTLVIVVLRKQEAVTMNKLLGFLLAFAGVIFIRDLSTVSFGSDTFLGDIFVFLGALSFALYLSYGKKFLMGHDSLWVTTWMLLISGLFMTLINITDLLSFEFPTIDSVFIASAAFTILGATLITYFLSNWALKKAPSGNVALFIYLQPVVAGLNGWYFLDEAITLRMIICSALIMSGLLVSILPNLLKKTA
jgi:drug/metabolite transporter (DMT)-like permease